MQTDYIKDQVKDYWSNRAEGFETQRIHEYDSKKKEQWLAEFRKYLPQGRSLRILDGGTGTGFFACILAEEGHETIGIDISPEMIRHAEHTASVLGTKTEFAVMDAEEPDFPAESFDAIVARNLTWTLPDLAGTYKRWLDLLKPGGVLINFDADYAKAIDDEDGQRLPENHAHKLVSPALQTENEFITMEVGAYQKPRPGWDVQLLAEAGYEHIQIDFGIYKRIYSEADEFYNPTPIFTIAAFKEQK